MSTVTYTAGVQGVSATPALDFMTTLDTLLVAAGYVFVEQKDKNSSTTLSAVLVGSTTNIAALSGLLTVDGVVLTAGDRVLVKNQTTTTQNGIYVAASGAWARSTDADATGEIVMGALVTITAGTTQVGQTWICANVTAGYPWVPGTSSTAWSPITSTSRIYRSPAGSNSFGQDWYLVINRSNDAQTFIGLGVAELFDSSTKLFRNYAPAPASLVPTATYAVDDVVGIQHTLVNKYNINCQPTGFQYWVSVNPDRIYVGVRNGLVEAALYVGLYDDLYPVALSPFPLCVLLLATGAAGSASWGATSREPGVTAAQTFNFAIFLNNTAYWQGLNTSTLPIDGLTRLWRVVPLAGRGLGNTATRASLKDALVVGPGGVSRANGDTISAVSLASGATVTYARISGGVFDIYVDTSV